MLNELIKFASLIRNKYKLDLHCNISTSDFYKARFLNDQENKNKICNLIYKKQQ